jgi:Formate/nitrite transporter
MIVDEKGNTITDAPAMPQLTERQEQEAEDRTNVSALVVHEAIRKDGDEELRRPISALAWSGLAAGLSMGFSFVGEALFRTYLPDAPWRPLITNLGYPLGFLIVIVGRQQLFTENTLTAIIPLLARRNLATLWQVLRLWAVVLAANIAGAHIFAWVIGNTAVLHPKFHLAMGELANGSRGRFPRQCNFTRHLCRMADRDGGLDAGCYGFQSDSDYRRDDLYCGSGRAHPHCGWIGGGTFSGDDWGQILDFGRWWLYDSDVDWKCARRRLASLRAESCAGDCRIAAGQENLALCDRSLWSRLSIR